MSSVLTCDTCERPIPSTGVQFYLEERSMLWSYSRPETREVDFCSAGCARKWFDDQYPEKRLSVGDFDRARAPLAEHAGAHSSYPCEPRGGDATRRSVLPVPDTTAQRITSDEWETST